VRTALDTNILSNLISGAPQAPAIDALLQRCLQEGMVLISPVAYAELLAHPKATKAFLDYFLSATGIQVDFQIDEAIWTEAGLRYARYAARRRTSLSVGPRRILADFVIGAHALKRADRLLTLDTTVFAKDFPELRLHPGLVP
jgi:predicted nucleic acid-binding protein